MVPVQYWLLTGSGLETTLAVRVAFGTGLAVTLPTVISSAVGHHRRGVVNWEAAIPMGIAAIFGALIGGTLASHLPGSILKTFFSVLVILMAIRMLWNIRECPACEIKGNKVIYGALGFSIGMISGLAGIGGGVILVPILILFLGYPIHTAVGTSSACLIFSSAGAVCAYAVNGLWVAGLPPYTVGYIDLVQWAVLAGTTIPLAQLGVRFAHQCTGYTLKLLLAALQVTVGILMLIM